MYVTITYDVAMMMRKNIWSRGRSTCRDHLRVKRYTFGIYFFVWIIDVVKTRRNEKSTRKVCDIFLYAGSIKFHAGAV